MKVTKLVHSLESLHYERSDLIKSLKFINGNYNNSATQSYFLNLISVAEADATKIV